MKLDQLGGLLTFMCVARKKSFSAAANELLVTPSAVSQTISQLERKLGVRLLNRTTRSVQLTEAGRVYYLKIKPAVEELLQASETLNDFTDQPVGVLRLNTPKIGYQNIIEPRLAKFLAVHPRLSFDLDIDDGFVDIVEQGYDAGIRLGEYVEKDMVAIRMGPDFHSAVVGSPAYFKKRPLPKRPADLKSHSCINFRYYKNKALYRWEFEVQGKDVSVDVRGCLTVNDSNIAIQAALEGVGITYALDVQVRDAIERGKLVRVLTSYSPKFPGLFLYYPSRKQMPAKLRAFIDFYKAQ
jgi:DNA-binding transcriptional LysR family regulator